MTEAERTFYVEQDRISLWLNDDGISKAPIALPRNAKEDREL